MDVSQYLGVFLDEAMEHIQSLNDNLMTHEQDPTNEDCINRNCIQSRCVRKNTKKKGFINSVITNTLKKITKTSSLRPVTKKRKKLLKSNE